MSTTVKTTAPTAVRTSFWCWVLLALINILGAIILMAGGGGALFAGVDDTDIAVDGESVTSTILLATGIIVLVLALIQVWLAFRMRAGRNWARIALTIVGIAALASMFTAGGAYPWITAAATLVATIGMLMPANADWFARRGALA